MVPAAPLVSVIEEEFGKVDAVAADEVEGK